MARVMVVDDQGSAVTALRDLLELDGHSVRAFTNPREALAALERQTFDAIVTDLDMPIVRGDVLVRATRRLQPSACVFLASARSSPPAGEDACHVFGKPLPYGDLNRLLSACRNGDHRGGARCSRVKATVETNAV
jgi:CheY-like chemotaxis protein